MRAVILAGGRGERLKPITDKIPKPLIKIGGKSLLEHQILLLKRYGILDIWILSGYLGEKIENHFRDGKKWHVKVHHLVEKTPLGTAGALKQLDGRIKDDFLVLSGDVILDVDLERLIKFHKKHKNSIATIVVHPNDHPFDSDLVEVNPNCEVRAFLIRQGKNQPRGLLFRNLTNAGVFVFSSRIFSYIEKNKKIDLEKNVFPIILASRGKIFAYSSPEYVKDVGTAQRLARVRRDYDSGKIARLNLRNRRKAIFLDRDGTLNVRDDSRDVRFSDFRLFPFTARAIKKINKSDYLAIVITNQPAIARGFISIEEIEKIHKKLETELGWQGAKIDGIYYCPHHPEKGFEGEVKELKIKCSCRKPKTGLVRQAARDFNIDLEKSFFIGDSTLDAKLAQNAGLKFVGVETGYAMSDGKYSLNEIVEICKNLLEAVNSIIVPR